MKKYLLGLFAVVLAVSISAFTRPATHTKTTQTQYWFSLNLDGTPQALGSIPPTSNTYTCGGAVDPCAAAFPGYTGTNPYTATGSEIAGTRTLKN